MADKEKKIKKDKPKTCVAKIGGQALLEGVMMRGPSGMAVAVRNTRNEIVIETTRLKKRSKWRKVPIVRGVLGFIDSIGTGVGTTMKSAELIEDGDEKISKGWTIFAVVIGLALGVAIFMLLPSLITDLLASGLKFKDNILLRSVIAGVMRLFIFVLYLVLVSIMKDIRRTFMYHGAEHRTIACYEHFEPLTVENVQKYSTRHDRCGTTFLFLVIIVSILVFALTNWLSKIIGLPDNVFVNMAVRLLLLPLVAGISYEILFGLAKLPNNLFVRIIKAPGLWMQKLTTKIPEDAMAEVAIRAFKAALALENDPNLSAINTGQYYMSMLREEIDLILKDTEGIEPADADWIIAHACRLKRSEINTVKIISKLSYKEAVNYAKERSTGKPLSQVLGVVSFYGIDIKVNSSVLSPRPETELLAERVIKGYREGDAVLDLCTGSGCIAVAVSEKTGARVTASDISEEALGIAAENTDGRNTELIKSDLFDGLSGRKFDIIVSNPPYIESGELDKLDKSVKNYEPHIALDGGADGLDFYKRIIKDAPAYLNNGGRLYLEAGYNQADRIAAILKDAGFVRIEVTKDYGGIDRIISAEINGGK